MTRPNYWKRMFTKIVEEKINEKFVKILVETGNVSEEERSKKPDYYTPSKEVIGDTIDKYNRLIDSYDHDPDNFEGWFKKKSKNYNDTIIDAALKKWIKKHGYYYILDKQYEGIRRKCINKKIFTESCKFYFESINGSNLLDVCLFEVFEYRDYMRLPSFKHLCQISFDRIRVLKLFLNVDEYRKLMDCIINLNLFDHFFNDITVYYTTDSEPIHVTAGYQDYYPLTIDMQLYDSNGHSAYFKIHQKEFDMLLNGQVVDFNPKTYREKYYTNFDCNVYAARIINMIYNKNINLSVGA